MPGLVPSTRPAGWVPAGPALVGCSGWPAIAPSTRTGTRTGQPDGVAVVGVRGDLWCRPYCATSGSSVNNSSMPGTSALATLAVNEHLDSVLCVDVGLWLL